MNVVRINEVVETDTVFSDVPSIDSGVTSEQFSQGWKQSFVTSLI